MWRGVMCALAAWLFWDGCAGMDDLSDFILCDVGPSSRCARALRRHFADNHSFGGASFSADLTLGAFYGALAKAVFFMIILIALFGGGTGAVAFMMLSDMFSGKSSGEDVALLFAVMPDEQKALFALPVVGVGFALFLSGQYFALVRHIMIDNLRLQGDQVPLAIIWI